MKRSFYINQITPFIDKGVVKVFTGIRRCGKSHIMGMVRDMLLSNGVREEQIVEANFESQKIDFVKKELYLEDGHRILLQNILDMEERK